jgi:transcriptional regulator with XRE-family HTH domain
MTTKLKLLRVQAGMTLEELANATDLTRSYVSKVERGVATPSISVTLRLAKALGVPMDHLFGASPESDPVTIVRREGDEEGNAGTTGKLELVAGTSAGHNMIAFVLRPADAKRHSHPKSHHAGEELIYVLSGSIGLQVANRKEVLHTGDCAHFDSTIPHKITAVSGPDAAALVVISPHAAAA